MKPFNFSIMQNCYFGKGALGKLPEILKTCGEKHVLLVSDRGLEGIGLVKKVQDLVTGAGLKCDTFLDVKANPTIEVDNACIKAFKESGATGLLALGGGSPMDVAKITGVVARYGGEVTDYEGPDKVPGPIPTLIAIPTTAGTGSEVTVNAVFTDTKRIFKGSLRSQEIVPKHAILDPELIMTAPASVAAACGIDAFVHALECYINTVTNPFSDAFAEKAMELIGGYIRRYVANRSDEDAASAMLLGSTFAGIAFSNARLGIVHAMSHPVSAYYDIAHGVANAVLLPSILEFNALADKGRYAKVYTYITGRLPGADFEPIRFVDEVRKLNIELGIPVGLEAVGVGADKIPAMSRDTFQNQGIMVNPRSVTLRDIEGIYHKAMKS